MSSTPFIFRVLNPIMKGVLVSPFHSLISKRIMILKFTGRKTGRAFATPVSYCREGDSVYCFTHAGWWKNFKGGAEVGMLIQGQEYKGTAISINDDQQKMVEALRKLLSNVPSDASFYGVKIDQQGNMDLDDLKKGIEDATMIEITIEKNSQTNQG